MIWGSKEPPDPEAGGARSQNPPVFFIPAAALGESRSSARGIGIGVGELSAEMEWLEKNLQENFDLPAKHPSEEALRRWRSAVSVVRNPRRRFRMVADLVSRSQNEARRRSIQVLTLLYCLSLPLTSPPCSGLRFTLPCTVLHSHALISSLSPLHPLLQFLSRPFQVYYQTLKPILPYPPGN